MFSLSWVVVIIKWQNGKHLADIISKCSSNYFCNLKYKVKKAELDCVKCRLLIILISSDQQFSTEKGFSSRRHLKMSGDFLFKLFFYNRNQMTTVDTLKFPVNRFIIAASSVWKYKQFPHLIIGRIWGSLTLPKQRIQCATSELCLVAGVLSFLLFAFSRSPRLFPEITILILPSK